MRMKFIIFFITIFICRIESIQFDELNFENNQDLITKQEHDSFERLKIEKVNAFFNAFKSELSKQDLKKFYKKLYSLVVECEQLIRNTAVVSNKDITNFLDTGLYLIHKKFQLHTNIDDFLQKFKSKFRPCIYFSLFFSIKTKKMSLLLNILRRNF